MDVYLFWIGVIVIIASLLSKVGNRIGIPIPLVFLGLGLIIGTDGLNLLNLQNYELVQNIASFALILIMFYGGFGVNVDSAKPIAVKAVVLSSFGTILTALIIALFASFVLNFTMVEGLLIGSVISSTDAASVFSILKSKQLSLKNKLDSLLEIESGSNDPFSYMLTLLSIALINGDRINIPMFLLEQIVVGLVVAIVISYIFATIISHIDLQLDGLYSIFILGVVFLSYTVAQYYGGNGFLCVYVTGIILNNSKKMPYKRSLVHFFDGISWLMQMVLFLSLGLLANPSEFTSIIGVALAIAFVTIFVARPISIFILLYKSNYSYKEKILISMAGIRGAASIVFSTFVLSLNNEFSRTVFNIVFFLVLISVLLQGGLLPLLTKKLDLIDENEDIEKTFSDYENEVDANLAEVTIYEDNVWLNRAIKEIETTSSMLVIMIKRNDKTIIPSGNTIIKLDDTLVFAFENHQEMDLLIENATV